MESKIALILLVIMLFILSGCSVYTPEPNPNKVLSDEDIRIEMQKLQKINEYPANKRINPKDYPVVLGVYAENNLTLIAGYYCSDVCPDYGRVTIVFSNISNKEQCAEAGGTDITDPAWGGYVGCAPAITTNDMALKE